jgi:Holliday junction resolvasome RuvABC endonuclease subunit
MQVSLIQPASPVLSASPPFCIGLDFGNDCGYGVLRFDGSRVVSGAWKLKGGRFDGGGMPVVRLLRLLGELLDAYPGAQVAFEEVASHGKGGAIAAQKYGGFAHSVMAFLEARGVPYAGCPVGTLKKTATGRGNAGKADIIRAANERWGLAIPADEKDGHDDEADALWCADCLRAGLL